MSVCNSKLFSYIGFSIKSRNIILGGDAILDSKKKVYVILMDNSINNTADKKINNYAKTHGIPIFRLKDGVVAEYSSIAKCKCLALLDSNLAMGAIKELREFSEVMANE